MDISSIKVENTREIDILDPRTRKPTGIKVTIESYGGDRAKTVQRQINNKRLKLRNRRPTAEELEEETLMTASAVVVGWNKEMEMDGKALSFTPENVRKIMSIPWIARQIDEAAEDEAAFIKA